MIIKCLESNPLRLPAIGQGMGEPHPWTQDDITWDVETNLMAGIECGMNLIDTAERYCISEQIIGKAIHNVRDNVILSSKFAPERTSFDQIIESCEQSLRRLDIDCIDLYQNHWPNPALDINEMLDAMVHLVEQHKIRHIGLSNLSANQLKKALRTPARKHIVSFQIEYNLFDRSAEEHIRPLCRKEKLFFIAYSPFNYGSVGNSEKEREQLLQIARKYDKSMYQIALKWIIHQSNAIAIPRTSSLEHLRANAKVADFDISEEDWSTINSACYNPVQYIDHKRIKIREMGQKNGVYLDIDSAKENLLGFNPSPVELSEDIFINDDIKPVRVSKDPKSEDFLLQSGMVRYWAWVFAYGSKRPIPILVIKD